MLFKTEILEGIKSGTISLAFRKWAKQSVKKGSLIKTSIGIIEVVDVFLTSLSEVSTMDAVRAGFSNTESLVENLNKIPSGNIYQIELKYKAPDPRLELRERTNLTDEELQLLDVRMARFDQFSKKGNWTLEILTAIKDHPNLKAADLALKVGKEKEWLKINVRNLKNLGLTISLDPGYRLSPLGEYYLEYRTQ